MPDTVPPPQSSDDDLYNQITLLNDNINQDPELSSNETIMAALNQINSQPRSSFSQSAGVITTLNQVLPKFTDPNSNAEDYASGSLQLVSSILYASSAIPGAVVVTAPLGFIVGLVGAIVGLFGAKKSNMLDQIKVIVNDATDRQTSEQMQQDLAGAYTEIRDKYITLCGILRDNSTIVPGGNYYNDYKQEDFTAVASNEIGAAIDNLRLNTQDLSKKDNWENTANTFYALSQVLIMKAMYISQGIAFFNIRQDPNNNTKNSQSSTLSSSAITIFDAYKTSAGPYVCRPNMYQAGVTHCIFRMDEIRFRLIGVLFSQLGLEFWPVNATQYRFTDTVSSMGHQGSACTRLTTLDMYHAGKEQVLYLDMHFVSGDKAQSAGTHFMLWADPDSNYSGYNPEPPRYRWYLQPAISASDAAGMQEVYIFEVSPSAQDRSTFKISDTANSLLMIGDTNKDNVWFSHTKEPQREKRGYADCISSSANANDCIWILLGEMQ